MLHWNVTKVSCCRVSKYRQLRLPRSSFKSILRSDWVFFLLLSLKYYIKHDYEIQIIIHFINNLFNVLKQSNFSYKCLKQRRKSHYQQVTTSFVTGSKFRENVYYYIYGYNSSIKLQVFLSNIIEPGRWYHIMYSLTFLRVFKCLV